MALTVSQAVVLCVTYMLTAVYARHSTSMHLGAKHGGALLQQTKVWSLAEIPGHDTKPDDMHVGYADDKEQLERGLQRVENDDGCGIATMFPDARIVNGNSSEIGEWPWQVMILRYVYYSGLVTRICGGTLIGNQWILTAAHCLEVDVTSYYLVVLGEYYSDLNTASPSREIRAIGSILCHESHSPSDHANDICLLKLVSPVSYNDYITPACLPADGDDPKAGDSCTFTGWGQVQDKYAGQPCEGAEPILSGVELMKIHRSGRDDVLQEADVEIISQSLCSEWWNEGGIKILDTHICAGDNGSVAGCYGDSGGPLVCKRNITDKSRYTVFGITSFGLSECELHPERPTVFTDVSKYLSWIDSTMTTAPDTSECFIQSTVRSCGTRFIRESGSIIRTPYSNTDSWTYPSNMDCVWDIRAPTGSYISLEFICFFHVEASDTSSGDQCPNDYMGIRSEQAGVNVGYCGVFGDPSDLDRLIKSNEATIFFHSDSREQTGGFVVRVKFVEPDSGRQNSQTVQALLLLFLLSFVMILID